jgi:hypothetical protein
MYRIQVFVLAFLFAMTSAAQQPSTIPQVDGELGPCWVDFRVTGEAGKPLYNAKVHVLVRHGFLSKRKTDLEVGTNADGKARVAGLPSSVRKPLLFDVRSGDAKKLVQHDPGANCHGRYDVSLGNNQPTQ